MKNWGRHVYPHFWMLANTELNDVNLTRVINTKVIPVAAYPMYVCKFTGGKLKELDQAEIEVKTHASMAEEE